MKECCTHSTPLHGCPTAAPCPRGFGGPFRCELCPIGTFSEGGQAMDDPQQACQPCSSGYATLTSGATSSKECTGSPLGWPRPAGTYRLACPAFWPVQQLLRAASLAQSPKNNADLAVLRCIHLRCIHLAACAPGYGANGSTECAPCSVGFYSQRPNTSVPRPRCVACPAGFTTANSSSDGVSSCTGTHYA